MNDTDDGASAYDQAFVVDVSVTPFDPVEVTARGRVAVWSPDQSRLAVESWVDEKLWLVDLDDPSETPEEVGEGIAAEDKRAPRFAPDGRHFTYAVDVETTTQLWLRTTIATAGSSGRRLEPAQGSTLLNAIEWTPDASWLIYARGSSYLMTRVVDGVPSPAIASYRPLYFRP